MITVLCLMNRKIKKIQFKVISNAKILLNEVIIGAVSQSFKLGSKFRVQEMEGRLPFLNFLEILHEKQSAFHFLDSEFRAQFERPTAPKIPITKIFQTHKGDWTVSNMVFL